MEYDPGRYPDWSDNPTEVLIDILEKWKSATGVMKDRQGSRGFRGWALCTEVPRNGKPT